MKTLSHKIKQKLHRRWLSTLPISNLRDRIGRNRSLTTFCYHTLAEDLDDYPYRTQASAFDSQLTFIKEVFEIVSVEEALSALRDQTVTQRSRPLALITFDDGYRDNWTVATQILEKHNVPCALFASKDLVQRGGATHMSETELKDLSAHPLWSVGAHAITHNALTGYRTEERLKEIRDSKSWLSDLLDTDPSGFAYPQGQLSEQIVEMAKQYYDYAFATDSRVGGGFDIHQIRRFCPMQIHDDIQQFALGILTAASEDGLH